MLTGRRLGGLAASCGGAARAGCAASARSVSPAATVLKQDYYAVKSHFGAVRVGCMASGRLTRSARRHGDMEIGFEAGLRAASAIKEGRAGIEEERASKRDGNCCRDV